MKDEKFKQEIQEMNDYQTFFLIDECGAFIWRMSHDLARGKITDDSDGSIRKDIENVKEIQMFAVNNLKKFGIDPESAKDKENGDYWKWYNHWNEWKKNMSDEDWRTLNWKLHCDEDVTELLPKNKWNE